ncbi:flagellar biosynthetic protein FliR [Andreprevotia chitinilytica]|uniref:flagellar biosynthetic protein FliR n=1 Tax=Andreprevotia chitinilytica TaxID=396808 RepID=UPI00054D3CCC|nr:flagellar biosynthetic protein FliR [Andreprevotia chitinilytica]
MLTITQAQIDLWLAMFWWPFLRIFGLLLTDPFYSSRSIPTRIRVGLAILLAVVLAPLVTVPAVPVVSPAGILIAVNQLLIGVMIGFAMRLMFSAVELAGHLSGLQMGLGFAMFFDPQHAAQVPVVAQFLSLVTLLLFLAFNGHLVMIRVLADSFIQLPIDPHPLGAGGLKLMADQGAMVFRMGMLLSLPVVGALLVANLAIGIMTRAAPQLNVFAVGFPLLLGIGLGALYLVMPYLPPHIDAMIGQVTRFIAQLMTASHPH